MNNSNTNKMSLKMKIAIVFFALMGLGAIIQTGQKKTYLELRHQISQDSKKNRYMKFANFPPENYHKSTRYVELVHQVIAIIQDEVTRSVEFDPVRTAALARAQKLNPHGDMSALVENLTTMLLYQARALGPSASVEQKQAAILQYWNTKGYAYFNIPVNGVFAHEVVPIMFYSEDPIEREMMKIPTNSINY